MSRILLILTFLAFAFSSNYSAATTQTITGNGNNQVNGNDNKINNNSHISDSPINIRQTKDYSSKQVKEDLEEGDYKGIKFEDKKRAKSPKKKVLILTATNFETGMLHAAAQKAGLEIQKALVHDHITNMGSLGGVDIVHMQPGMMGMLEPGSTPLILRSVFRELQPDYVSSLGLFL